MIYVYVIASDPQGPVKLGFSAHPDRRLKQLQTGHAQTLTLYHKQGFDPPRAKIIEKLIHKQVSAYRQRGEWFSLTVEQAIQEVDFALIRYGEEDLALLKRQR